MASPFVQRFLFALSAGAALTLAGCSDVSNVHAKLHHRISSMFSDEPVTLRAADERKKAPNFTLKDADGRDVSLADYKGKVVVLNFWATWCGPCKVEIPWFMDFEQKYKAQGFAVLGVSMDEDGWASVKPFLGEEKVNYRVVVGSDTVGSLYGGLDSLPTTFLLDRDGKIAKTHVGLVTKKEYESEIVQLLDTTSARLDGAVHSATGPN